MSLWCTSYFLPCSEDEMLDFWPLWHCLLFSCTDLYKFLVQKVLVEKVTCYRLSTSVLGPVSSRGRGATRWSLFLVLYQKVTWDRFWPQFYVSLFRRSSTVVLCSVSWPFRSWTTGCWPLYFFVLCQKVAWSMFLTPGLCPPCSEGDPAGCDQLWRCERLQLLQDNLPRSALLSSL
jgi:hypothetical protein